MHLLSIIVVVNSAVACGARRSIHAVAFSERVAAVEVVLGIVREGQGWCIVETATASSSTCSVDSTDMVDDHVHVDATEGNILHVR